MFDPISVQMAQRDADHFARNGATVAAQVSTPRVVELPSERGWAVAKNEEEARRLMAAWVSREDRRARRVTYLAALGALLSIATGVLGLLEGWWG